MAEVLSENDLNSDRETPDCDERLKNDVRRRLSFGNNNEADDRNTTPSSDQNCDSCKNNSCNNNNNNLSFSIDSILSSSSKRQRQKNENISKDTNSKEIEDITDDSELKDSSHVLDFQSCPRLVKEDGTQGRDGENRSPSDSYYSIANHLAMWSYRDINKDRFGVVRRIGHPYQNRTPPKRKKPRTSFTRLQIMELERRFEQQKYLASSERSTIAKSLKMSDSQVKTWFQNRRTKWRRQTAEEKELERQAANRLLMSIGRCAGKNLPLNNAII